MRHIVLFFFALFIFTAPAFAAPAINAEGAAKLKKEVEDMLSFHKKMAETMQKGMTLSGEVEVTPKGNAYEVKLPGFTVVSGSDKLNLGTLTIMATPGDKGEYATTFTLPSPMILRDEKDVPQVETTVGQQSFNGIWWPTLGAYTKLDASLQDIVIKGLTEENNFNIAIGTMKSTMDLKQNPDNTWSGPQLAEASNITVTAPATEDTGARTLRAAHLGGQAIYDKMDLVATQAIRQKFGLLFKDGAKPSQEDINKAVLEIYKDQKSLFDGLASDFMLVDLAYEAAPGPKAAKDEKPVVVRLAKFSSIAEAKDMMAAKSNGRMKLALDGLSVPNATADTLAVIPTKANIEVSLDDVPAQDLARIMAEMNVLTMMPTDNKQAQQQQQQKLTELTNSLGKILAKAGASLTVRDTYFNAPELNMTLGGKMVAKEGVAPVALGSEGTLTLAIEGMDELLLKEPNTKNPTQTKQILTVFQMMGQPGKSANGKSLRTYKLETMADGRVLLNNADISMFSTLMGGLKAAPQTAPVAPAPDKKTP